MTKQDLAEELKANYGDSMSRSQIEKHFRMRHGSCPVEKLTEFQNPGSSWRRYETDSVAEYRWRACRRVGVFH
jgi:hypothetical protein